MFHEQNLGDGFIKNAVETRINKGRYYSINSEYELIYRLYAYNSNKKKKHHADWIKEHIYDINPNMIDRYYPCSLSSLNDVLKLSALTKVGVKAETVSKQNLIKN